MKTLSQMRTQFGSLTKNSTSTNITFGDTYLNDSIRTICNLQGGKLRFLESTTNMYTTENQETYQIPNKYRKLIDMYIYDGTGSSTDTIYAPKMIFDPTIWKRILQSHLGTQQVPYFIYVENRTFKIQPIPSVTGNLIVVRGRLNTRDLTIADYSTGTIVSVPYAQTFTAVVASGATSATLTGAFALPTGTYQILFSNGEMRAALFTNSSTAVTWEDATTSASTASITVNGSGGGSIITGSGTTFTEDMVGRYIQITQTTAANGGDGFWYEIADYIDATHVILTKPYEGVLISAGSATYIIGQVPIVPEAYQPAIVYRAVAMYWQQQGDLATAKSYWMMYDGGYEAGYRDDYGGIISQMLANEGETEEGAYIPPFGSSDNIIGRAYYYPWQQATGF